MTKKISHCNTVTYLFLWFQKPPKVGITLSFLDSYIVLAKRIIEGSLLICAFFSFSND